MENEKDFQKRMQRLEGLIQGVERYADPEAKAHTREIVQSVLDLHGAGLERILEQLAGAGEPGMAMIDSLARDGLVGSLLLLYGLHPLDVETRVRQALDGVRPYLRSHGGNVELLGVEEGVVRLRMQGNCHGCPSSAMTLKLAIEEAIYEKAPDVTAIEVEEAGGQTNGAPATFIPVEALVAKKGPPAAGGWEEVPGLLSFPEGTLATREVAGRAVLFCRVDGTMYAHEPSCPGCGGDLKGGRLEGTVLICPGCGRRYDLGRAGRGVDEPNLQLEPFPLLEEGGRVKVALPAGRT